PLRAPRLPPHRRPPELLRRRLRNRRRVVALSRRDRPHPRQNHLRRRAPQNLLPPNPRAHPTLALSQLRVRGELALSSSAQGRRLERQTTRNAPNYVESGVEQRARVGETPPNSLELTSAEGARAAL